MPCVADGSAQQQTADRVTTALITQIHFTKPVTQFIIPARRTQNVYTPKEINNIYCMNKIFYSSLRPVHTKKDDYNNNYKTITILVSTPNGNNVLFIISYIQLYCLPLFKVR